MRSSYFSVRDAIQPRRLQSGSLWTRSFEEDAAPTLVLYHADCADGFAAALSVHARVGDRARYIPVNYHQPPPHVLGEIVLIVDFSYPYEQLVQISRDAQSVVVLDHHESQRPDLRRALSEMLVDGACSETRSGAGLAWDWANRGENGHICSEFYPRLIRAVEDRDLWVDAYPDSRQICAYADTVPHEFAGWHALLAELGHVGETTDRLGSIRDTGASLLGLVERQIDHIIATTLRSWILDGKEVPVVNCPRWFASDSCNRLAKTSPHGFAAAYVDTPSGRKVSLRSVGSVEIVGIAKSYGGGGHAQAASFLAQHGWEGE